MARSTKLKDDKVMMKSSKENEPAGENGKKKTKEERPATKVVVRRLPPTMTAEQFLQQVSPLSETDYFYFVPADMSLSPNAFCRAYINFVDQADLFIFTEKFDGYVFLDNKGGEYPAVVEFAPFQRIPKNRPNRKKDPKVGTIESDPIYIQFKEQIEAQLLENKTTANVSKQHFFETTLEPEKKEANNTPLLDFIKNKRAERQRVRDEKRDEKRKRDLERKRIKDEQKRVRKEDDTSALKVLSNQSASSSRDRVREKETNPVYVKKKYDDLKLAPKEKFTDLRIKDGKTRTGKSYLEERQRLAERREEQKRKLSQSSTSLTDTKASTEEKPEEEDMSEPGSKVTERPFKRDEARGGSYKYENKREREGEDVRRQKRVGERGYRRDDERIEESGRKRYSESRKNYDSQRDKYKDKNKPYNSKKTSESVEVDKANRSSDKLSKHESGSEDVARSDDIKEASSKESSDIVENEKINVNSDNPTTVETMSSEFGKKTKQFEPKDKINPSRRKSFDYEKNRQGSGYNSNKSNNNKDKYVDKKRRDSISSGKNQEGTDDKTHQTRTTSDNEAKELLSDKAECSSVDKHTPQNEEISPEQDNSLKKEFENSEGNIPKRRNSTGERQSPEKPRRNSLGSEDKNVVCTFDEESNFDNDNFDNTLTKETSKNEKKQQRNSRDPRTERRIRNKDRPTMEIYRPGMGKFSKQRLERGKVLGSSTEIESPSSSPSPTPVMKHKIFPGSQN